MKTTSFIFRTLLVILIAGIFTNCKKDDAYTTIEEEARFAPYPTETHDFPHICIDQTTHEHSPSGVDLRGFAMKNKLWNNGQTLRVKFLNGSDYVKNKVREYAIQWENHANIHFDFVASGDAEIRITFNRGGSWSKVGTDALSVAQDRATMNFGWFDENTSESSFSRTTIHEFGHALGIKHEHQNPTVGIKWNKEKVYADMAESGWDKAKVDHNIFRKYSRDHTEYCNHDPASLMNYSIPNSWTTDDFEVPYNTVLSEGDKNFVSLLYPFGGGENLDCEDMKNSYIGLRHSGAYVARMIVTWTEYSNTGTANKRYESGWRAVGYRHNVPVKANARNIQVVAIAKTGNIFKPTKMILNQRARVGQCYKLSGTVFGYRVTGDCN